MRVVVSILADISRCRLKLAKINSARVGLNISRHFAPSSLAHVQKYEHTYEDTNAYLDPNCLAYTPFPLETAITSPSYAHRAFYLSYSTILSEMIVFSFPTFYLSYSTILSEMIVFSLPKCTFHRDVVWCRCHPHRAYDI